MSGSGMRAVDTNVLVRLITRDDATQARAAESFIAGGAWVSLLEVAEIAWVLATVYGLSARDVAQAIEMLLRHESLVLQDAETIEEALRLYRTTPGLGFSDCLMLHLAKRAGHVPLGTFDRKLGRVAGALKL